jgi:hypothetical protein
MSSIIRIKRSTTAGDPSTLGSGELAYSGANYGTVLGGGRLYVGIGVETGGDAASHVVIGGQYFTDMMDHEKGTLTAGSAIITNEDNKINQLNVDNININGNTISALNTNGEIVLSPSGDGNVSVSSKRIVSLAAPISPSDAATKLYVDNLVSQENIQDLTGAMISGGVQNGISVTYDDVGDAIDFNVNNFDVALTGVVTGSATVSNLSNISIATLLSNNSVELGTHTTGNYLESVSAGTGVTITNNAPGEGISPVFAIGQDVSTTADVAFNNLTVNGQLSTDDITAQAVYASGNMIVQGNLTVNGTTTTVNSNEVSIGDAILLLNADEVGTPSQNAGLEIERGTSANVSFVWNETLDRWYTTNNIQANSFSGSLIGNSDSASILETARTITIGGDTAGSADFDGSSNILINTTLANSGVVAGTYGTSTSVPSFTVDAKGRITNVTTSTLDTVFDIAGDTGSDTVNLAGGTLSIVGGEGINTTIVNGDFAIAAEIATYTNKGIAAFSNADFTVTNGQVSINEIDGGTF